MADHSDEIGKKKKKRNNVNKDQMAEYLQHFNQISNDLQNGNGTSDVPVGGSYGPHSSLDYHNGANDSQLPAGAREKIRAVSAPKDDEDIAMNEYQTELKDNADIDDLKSTNEPAIHHGMLPANIRSIHTYYIRLYIYVYMNICMYI